MPLTTSLTASVAIIPWLRGAFPGFIVGLRHDGQLYRFATYTGAAIERLDVADTHVTWHMSGPRRPHRTPRRLEIVAWRAEGGLLLSPERSQWSRGYSRASLHGSTCACCRPKAAANG